MPKIKVNIIRSEESKSILCVEDNGIGFEMKYCEKIFDIFQRLHLPEEYPGTGIGLALVKKAMQRIGGRAWAESQPGTGAKFYLEIPG
jgi:light-regulated signal transduction histidine kinase (bacteriophytochrome)